MQGLNGRGRFVSQLELVYRLTGTVFNAPHRSEISFALSLQILGDPRKHQGFLLSHFLKPFPATSADPGRSVEGTNPDHPSDDRDEDPVRVADARYRLEVISFRDGGEGSDAMGKSGGRSPVQAPRPTKYRDTVRDGEPNEYGCSCARSVQQFSATRRRSLGTSGSLGSQNESDCLTMWSNAAEFLDGIYEPLTTGYYVQSLRVEGRIPDDLNGTLDRNGSNAKYGPSNVENFHWFDGDGMVHAFHLNDGWARYQNRLVQTEGLDVEDGEGRSLYNGIYSNAAVALPPLPVGAPEFKLVANVNVVALGRKSFALQESGDHWYQIDPVSLDVVRTSDFDGQGPHWSSGGWCRSHSSSPTR